MTSGSFQVGETVHGEEADGTRLISFRVAQSNHRTGGYNAPEKFYTLNPYTKDNPTTIAGLADGRIIFKKVFWGDNPRFLPTSIKFCD